MQLFLDPFSPPASFLYCDVTVITSSLHHTLLHRTTLNILVVGRTDALHSDFLSLRPLCGLCLPFSSFASICHSDWTMEAKHKGVSPPSCRRANDLILSACRGRSRAHPERAHAEQEYKSLCFCRVSDRADRDIWDVLQVSIAAVSINDVTASRVALQHPPLGFERPRPPGRHHNQLLLLLLLDCWSHRLETGAILAGVL